MKTQELAMLRAIADRAQGFFVIEPEGQSTMNPALLRELLDDYARVVARVTDGFGHAGSCLSLNERLLQVAQDVVTEANSGILWRDQNPMMVKAIADLQVELSHLRARNGEPS